MKTGDILILLDGRMLRILHLDESSDVMNVQFIDKDDSNYLIQTGLYVQDNLGTEPAVIAMFNAARSIHTRLNQLAKV